MVILFVLSILVPGLTILNISPALTGLLLCIQQSFLCVLVRYHDRVRICREERERYAEIERERYIILLRSMHHTLYNYNYNYNASFSLPYIRTYIHMCFVCLGICVVFSTNWSLSVLLGCIHLCGWQLSRSFAILITKNPKRYPIQLLFLLFVVIYAFCVCLSLSHTHTHNAHIYTHTHAHAYTHTYTHIHTHIHTCKILLTLINH